MESSLTSGEFSRSNQDLSRIRFYEIQRTSYKALRTQEFGKYFRILSVADLNRTTNSYCFKRDDRTVNGKDWRRRKDTMHKMNEISQERIEDESPKNGKDRETLRERLKKKRKYTKTRKIEQKLWRKKNKAKEKKVKKKGEQYMSYMY